MTFELFAPSKGLAHEVSLRDYLIDQPNLDRLSRRKGACKKNHFARQPLANDAREILCGPNGGAGPNPRSRLAKDGVLGCDDEVTPQRKLMAASHAVAIHHRDYRHGQA